MLWKMHVLLSVSAGGCVTKVCVKAADGDLARFCALSYLFIVIIPDRAFSPCATRTWHSTVGCQMLLLRPDVRNTCQRTPCDSYGCNMRSWAAPHFNRKLRGCLKGTFHPTNTHSLSRAVEYSECEIVHHDIFTWQQFAVKKGTKIDLRLLGLRSFAERLRWRFPDVRCALSGRRCQRVGKW